MYCPRFYLTALITSLLFIPSMLSPVYGQAKLQHPESSTASFEGILAQTTSSQSPQADQLLQQGVEQFSSGQVEAAAQSFQQALTIFQKNQDRKGEWSAVYFLGVIYSSVRNFSQGIDYLQQSLVLAQKLADRQKEWDALKALGSTYAASADMTKAAEHYQLSLTVARAMSDRYKEAQSLESLSNVYKVLGDAAKAEEYRQQSLDIVRELGVGQSDGIGDQQQRLQLALKEGEQLRDEGTRTSLPKAIAKYEEALSLARTLKERPSEAIALLSLGGVYDDLGEKQKALNYYNQALPLLKTLNNPLFEATALLSIASVYSDLGEKQKALDSYKQALPILKATGNQFGESTILNNIGGIYLDLAEYPQALNYYNQSLSIARVLKDSSKEAILLNNIGKIYSQLGEYQRALDYFNQGLPLLKAIGEKSSQAAILDNIATVYFFLGQKQKALNYFNQTLLVKKDSADRAQQAVTLANIGSVYFDLGENQKALDYYNQSLSLVKALQDPFKEATALSNIGRVYVELGDNQKALNYYNQALSLAQKVNQPLEIATTLGKIGQLYYVQENYGKATEHLQQSLAMMRQMQDRLGEGKILNSLGRVFLASGQLTKSEETFGDGIQIWESIRAGLGSNDINKVSIFEEQAITYRLLQKTLVAQKKPEAALEIAERGRARAFVELLAGRLAQTNITPPTIQQIRQIAKEQNATLVEYSIISEDLKVQGTTESRKPLELFIWVVKPTGEVAFRQVKLQSSLRSNTSLETLVFNSREEMGVRGRGLQVVVNQDQTRQGNQLQQLYQLLIQPIADQLPKDSAERVIFIPQKELFLVPFAALQDASGKYLIEKHTILTAPAIQVLQLTHQQRQKLGTRDWGLGTGEERSYSAAKDFLIIGNPTMPSIPPQVGEPLQQLPSLPGAELEAKVIAQLLNTKAITGKDATKASLLPQLSKARLIHLATHGLLDDFKGLGVPGAVALAPSGSDNGLLTASEILDLQLNAELVVLSACDTGRGTITGDGVIGLSRSLISAGVPSVIVSLWSVPDAPTAALMTEFYRQLRQNADKAQALRSAMLSTMKQHPDPKDWAAFTLIGEAQ